MAIYAILFVFFGFIGTICAQNSTCDNIYVVGADDTLGFAGGVTGFPELDGCYGVGTTTVYGGEEENIAYFYFDEVDGKGPAFTTLTLEDGSVYWDLFQYDVNHVFGTIVTASPLLMFKEKEFPRIENEVNWVGVDYSGSDPTPFEITTEDISISCGCPVVSPTQETPAPEPIVTQEPTVTPEPEPSAGSFVPAVPAGVSNNSRVSVSVGEFVGIVFAIFFVSLFIIGMIVLSVKKCKDRRESAINSIDNHTDFPPGFVVEP